MPNRPEPLSYEANPPRPAPWRLRTSWWSLAPFLATAILLPPTLLFAGIEVTGLLVTSCAAAAGFSLTRAGNVNDRLTTAATLVLCALALPALTIVERARCSTVAIACAANLRTIAQGCILLEDQGATAYSLNDVQQRLGMNKPLQCPLHPGKPGTTYVLLPHLQPYNVRGNSASVVVGYCLEAHPTQKHGWSDKRLMTLLYRDGHVETHDPLSAQKLISASLETTTRPTDPHPLR